jgi:Tol biopolymer transport system component
MDQDRWQRLRRLFESARELEPEARGAFLDEACADDTGLRAEVESLLREEAGSKDPIDDVVREAAREVKAATPAPSLATGRRIAHYEVVDKLGEGGMGEVYVAEDTQLGRKVALKVLAPRIAGDAQALSRFRREARAVAALNHPHILAVYDMGTDEDVSYVVFELLEGETLRARLAKGATPVRKAVEYGVQICGGLTAAHARSIVHRDLKPENLFLTAEGQVKILDFGLAGLGAAPVGTESPPESEATTVTTPGMAMGTPGYMSPEQVRGETVDARSDIFSLGSVLYEMLSGRRAFRGDSIQETLRAILGEDPPALSAVSSAVPPALERILRRCLEKRPEDRFQSAHDLALALEAVSGVSAPLRLPLPRGRRLGWMGVAAAVAGAAIVAWGVLGPGDDQGEVASLPPMTATLVTSDDAIEAVPALSPDGRFLAFLRQEEEGWNLYVKQIGGGEPIRITEADYGDLAWSPDGNQIAFHREIETEDQSPRFGIFVVPALGGSERQLITGSGYPAVSWSPDGRYLAYGDRDNPEDRVGIFLLDLETGARRKLTAPPDEYLVGDYSPRFSPDGESVAFVRAAVLTNPDIWIAPLDGEEPRRLTSGLRSATGLSWTPDGESLVFSAGLVPRVGYFSLWRITVSGGDPEPLEVGELGITPTVSREGNRLAYVRWESDWDIWRVGGPNAQGEIGPPEPFIASNSHEWEQEYSPDGQKILFTSGRSGYLEIWTADSDGSNVRPLTSLEDLMSTAGTWSPDSRHIAFHSPKEGDHDIYVVSATGGIPRRLTTAPWDEAGPVWSRDGRWVYFSSNRSGRLEVWKVPAEGGDQVQVTHTGGGGGVESPDGRHLYFVKSNMEGGQPGLWRIPMEGGPEERVLEHVRFIDWAPFDQGICFINRSDPSAAVIEFYEYATGTVSEVTRLPFQPLIQGISVSPDGRWILLLRGEERTDIMLVENFQ